MAKRKKPGRPALPASKRKSRILKFRSREDLVSRLQQAANKSGRSVSEEIEHRLEGSFQQEDFRRLLQEQLEENAQNSREALVRSWGFDPDDPDSVRNAEQAVTRIWAERNPAKDEQAVREDVRELIRRVGQRTDEDVRAHGLSTLLRFFRRTEEGKS